MFQGPAGSGSPSVPTDVDADLVAALRREDPEAVDRLVERFGDRVYRLAVRVVGVKADAEEVAQDALWLAASKIRTFRGDAALGSWIYRITANVAYQKLRARRRTATDVALDDVLPILDSDGHFAAMDDWSRRVEDHALQVELRAALSDAIDALPPEHRVVLALHDIEGMSNPDIAGTLGLSLPAVKSRLHRSRLFVRKRLSDALGRGAL